MRILGIIPARAGSKRIPGKNTKLLNNKPLIQYTIESAKQSHNIDKLIVSTEDQFIADLANSLDVEVPFLRPDYLAHDDAKSLPVVEHAIDYFVKNGEYFDAVILLQVTSPFRKAMHINESIELFVKHSNADSLVSLVEVNHIYTPENIMNFSMNDFVELFSMSYPIKKQGKYYSRNGAIYISRISSLKDMNHLFGLQCLGYIMDEKYSLDIDSPIDFKFAEFLLNQS